MKALTGVGDKLRKTKQIAQLAAKQQRNITCAQLRAIGLDGAAIHRRVAAGFLHSQYRGVYSVGTPPLTPHEHAMAAVLACGPGAVLSHGSALALWGIWRRWDRPFEVTVRADRRPKGIKVYRARRLDRRDTTRHHGILVTTLARTLLDMAPQMRPKSLNRAVSTGRSEHHLSLDALADVVRRHPVHPGARKLSDVVGIASNRPARSDFEDDFPAFCERYGLPAPLTNVLICGYEVDVLFPDEKVIVELDGWAFHSSRRSFEDDRNRDADLLAEGFVTIRLTWERYDSRPDEEAVRLHAILRQRRRQAA